MAGNVASEGSSGPLASLNGSAPIAATKPDIIRSLLTVGYPSRKAAIKSVGRWREKLLVAMATGYLDGKLGTTRYFRNLEQSEKVGVSFLLGEAFTHWYAQDHEGLVGREIDDGVFFALDRKIFDTMRERPHDATMRQQQFDEVFGILEGRSEFYEGKRAAEISPGPDGTLLLDRRNPIQRRRLRPRG